MMNNLITSVTLSVIEPSTELVIFRMIIRLSLILIYSEILFLNFIFYIFFIQGFTVGGGLLLVFGTDMI